MGFSKTTLAAWLFALLFLPQSHATITLEALNEAGSTTGTIPTYYYPTIGTGGCAAANQLLWPPELTAMNPAAANTGPIFSIKSDVKRAILGGGSEGDPEPDLNAVAIHVEVGTKDVAIFPYESGEYADTSAHYVRYPTTNGTVKFGISLADIARESDGYGYCSPTLDLLSKCQYDSTDTPTIVTVTVGIVKTGTRTDTSGETADETNIKIVLASCPPVKDYTAPLLAPISSATTVPGDQRVRVLNSSATVIDRTNALAGTVVFATATDPAGTPLKYSNASVRQFFGITTGTLNVDGLTNDTDYWFGIGYVNKAGFVSTGDNWGDVAIADFGPETPRRIDGFLDRSTCFVATAAYGDENDSRLQVLRDFRDEVLLKNRFGRAFVRWYYSWSPEAAMWLKNHPVARQVVSAMLTPTVLAADLWMRATK